MTTYTSNLGLPNPTPLVDDANVWGATENTGRTLVDAAVAGYLSVNVGGSANYVLTVANGAVDQERNKHFNFTGVLTGNIVVIFPQSRSKQFSVANNTTGAFTLSVGANDGTGNPAGTTVTVPTGAAMALGSDGTNVFVRVNSAGIGLPTGTSGHVLGYLDGNNTISGSWTFSAALNYGGVTLTNAVTGTGKMVLDTSPALTTPDLGTPTALVLTNATGLPNASVIGLGTAALDNTGTSGATIPLLNGNNTYSGTANFTSTLQVSSVTVATISDTQTLTNKRITKRVVAASATTGTVTPNSDTTDVYKAEGLTGSLTIANPSGTPTDGQQLVIRIQDNGTGRALSFGANFVIIGVTLPTTTVANKWIYVGTQYNGTSTKWDVLAVGQQA